MNPDSPSTPQHEPAQRKHRRHQQAQSHLANFSFNLGDVYASYSSSFTIHPSHITVNFNHPNWNCQKHTHHHSNQVLFDDIHEKNKTIRICKETSQWGK